jgi:hypothetical protein
MKELKLNGKTYHINKFGALSGRAIVAQYPLSVILHNKEYERNEEVMLRLMSHVEAVLADGSTQALSTRALIDNHVADWSDLVAIEIEALKYNAPQFFDGTAQSIMGRAESWITARLTKVMGDAIGENLMGVLNQTKENE